MDVLDLDERSDTKVGTTLGGVRRSGERGGQRRRGQRRRQKSKGELGHGGQIGKSRALLELATFNSFPGCDWLCLVLVASMSGVSPILGSSLTLGPLSVRVVRSKIRCTIVRLDIRLSSAQSPPESSSESDGLRRLARDKAHLLNNLTATGLRVKAVV